MICSNCSKEIRDTAKVCGYCGHRFPSPPAKCPDCEKDVRKGAQVCGYCGYKFEVAAPVTAPAPREKMQSPELPPEPLITSEPEPVPAVQVGPKSVPSHEEEKSPESPPEPESAPKPKAKPAKIEADVHSRSEAKASKSAQKSLIWVWVLVALIAIAGVFMLGQTRGWFAQEAFAGAIGSWETRDSGDNSNQTLTIRKTLQGEYKLDFHDDFATICEGNAASATMTGTTSTDTLLTRMEIQCELSVNQIDNYPDEYFNVRLTYNPANDTLKDSYGDIWTRQ